MSATNPTIRRLLAADASAFRDIRLEALEVNPEAFGAAFEAESMQPLSFFEGSLETSEVLGAFIDGGIAGVAGLYGNQSPKKAHKVGLWTMYVRPTKRRLGIGRKLVEAAIDAAARRAELIQLAVVVGNDAALKLYSSLGFSTYGLEVHALKVDGRYYDEVLMARALTPPRP